VASQPRLVEIDLADPLPVLDEELALIEAHFAELIAAMLEPEAAVPELA